MPLALFDRYGIFPTVLAFKMYLRDAREKLLHHLVFNSTLAIQQDKDKGAERRSDFNLFLLLLFDLGFGTEGKAGREQHVVPHPLYC